MEAKKAKIANGWTDGNGNYEQLLFNPNLAGGGVIFAPGFLMFKIKPHLTTYTHLKYLSKLLFFGFLCYPVVPDA